MTIIQGALSKQSLKSTASPDDKIFPVTGVTCKERFLSRVTRFTHTAVGDNGADDVRGVPGGRESDPLGAL